MDTEDYVIKFKNIIEFEFSDYNFAIQYNQDQNGSFWIVKSFDQAIGETHQIPGSIWDLGKNLASHAIKNKKK